MKEADIYDAEEELHIIVNISTSIGHQRLLVEGGGAVPCDLGTNNLYL